MSLKMSSFLVQDMYNEKMMFSMMALNSQHAAQITGNICLKQGLDIPIEVCVQDVENETCDIFKMSTSVSVVVNSIPVGPDDPRTPGLIHDFKNDGDLHDENEIETNMNRKVEQEKREGNVITFPRS